MLQWSKTKWNRYKDTQTESDMSIKDIKWVKIHFAETNNGSGDINVSTDLPQTKYSNSNFQKHNKNSKILPGQTVAIGISIAVRVSKSKL